MKEYKHFGVMLDCSRNAVMKIETLKVFINLLEKMGYNTLELYTEDTYEVTGEPYFGYLRGRYTGAELKEIDAYAKKHGIELIPCIQTLAHLANIFKMPQYSDVRDYGDILLIDEEKTYELIDKMFASLAENFTSRNVNIGMDEAHMVGLGNFLDRNGYQNRFDIILRHLNRVIEIAQKYGFTAHMWSDMFFRLHNHGDYYGKDIHIPQEVIDKVPENVQLTYWDYYHDNIEDYDSMMQSHKEFNRQIWFAGGVWTWNGFAPLNKYSLHSMKPAMESVVKNGIDNVLMTMWGDNGKECSFFSVLPALYTIRQYADGNFDEEKIKEGFEKTLHIKYDDFMLLDCPNFSRSNPTGEIVQDSCKSLLYTDVLMGDLNPEIEKQGEIPFKQYADNLKQAGKRSKKYEYVFTYLSKLCLVLDKKYYLGVRTRKAYESNDKRTLSILLKEDYAVLPGRIKEFHKAFKELWFKENKPFGWEIQDARLGGLITRIETITLRIKDYLKGRIDRIEELEEELLPDCSFLQNNSYQYLIGYSNI